jgi:hypothetical protein
MEGGAVIILCAWCEQEGKPAVLYTRDDSASGWEIHSHGICKAHLDRMLLDMHGSFPNAVATALPNSIQKPFTRNPPA